jgi:DNA-binding YbaB/EbfC family protein
MNFDIKSLMEQAKQLQVEIEKSQSKLEEVICVGSAGADMIQVTMNGRNKVLSVDISDELLKFKDKKMMEDLFVAAINNAVDKIQAETKKEMGKFTAGIPDFQALFS